MADLAKLLNRSPSVSIGVLAVVGFALGSGALAGLLRGVLPARTPPPPPPPPAPEA